MRNLDQAAAETRANVSVNPFVMAKAGQLSLMPTIAVEFPAPEMPAGQADAEPPAEQSA